MSNAEVFSQHKYGEAPFFVFCDHASNTIPNDLNSLGLPGDLLQTHIAWDIGAADTASEIARQLSGFYFRSEFSRLIIDPNRALTTDDVIPATSDQIPVPGNQMLSEEQRRARVERFHVPYHDALSANLDAMMNSDASPFIVSIHSFTNRLMGSAEERPWPIGLLWREDEESAKAIIDILEQKTGWPIGDNEPYDAREFNYSVDRHIGPRKLRHLTIEVRQDYLSNPDKITHIANLIADGVRTIAP